MNKKSECSLTVLRFINEAVENNLGTVIKKIQEWVYENDLTSHEP